MPAAISSPPTVRPATAPPTEAFLRLREAFPRPAAVPRHRGDGLKHIFIALLIGIELLPVYMMLQVSVKDNAGFLANPWLPALPSQWHGENFAAGLRLIAPLVANSIVVALSTTVIGTGLSLFAAYFFARQRMPGARFLWASFLALMLMPSVANLAPLFTLLKSLSLLNTLWALIVVGVAGAQVFNIFVLRNFIEEIPRDLFEAAEIDGASHFQQLWNVVLPLSGPILGTLVILGFLGSWNDFLLPLIVLRDKELFTLGVGLIYLDGEYIKQWGQIMAAYLLASLPLIVMFLFTMKLFIRGLSSGGIKG